MAVALAIVAVVFMVLAGAAGGLLLKAVGEVMDLRKEKESLQDEVVTQRQYLADIEADNEILRKDSERKEQWARSVEAALKKREARFMELDKDWVEARNRCGVLEAELAAQQDSVVVMSSQLARQCEEEKALRAAFSQQEAAMREALKKERAESDRRENAAIMARAEFHRDAVEAKKLVASLREEVEKRDQVVLAMKAECEAYAALLTDIRKNLDRTSGGMIRTRDEISVLLEAYPRPLPDAAEGE